MDSFYVTLPSNVKDIFNKNTISNYITKLASVIRLDSSWEVGLSEFLYKKSWFNVEKPQNIALIDEKGNIFRDNSIVIDRGFYPSPENLINVVNNKVNILKNYMVEINMFREDLIRAPKLVFEEYSFKARLTSGFIIQNEDKIALDLVLSEEISKILGMNRYMSIFDIDDREINHVENQYELIKDNVVHYAEADIDAGIHTLYVYCDIIKPSFVGDTFSNLLRAIHVPKVQFGESVQVTFENPHYIPLNSNEISSIEIDIKDDIGETIKFRFGRVITVLHFRRNESN